MIKCMMHALHSIYNACFLNTFLWNFEPSTWKSACVSLHVWRLLGVLDCKSWEAFYRTVIGHVPRRINWRGGLCRPGRNTWSWRKEISAALAVWDLAQALELASATMGLQAQPRLALCESDGEREETGGAAVVPRDLKAVNTGFEGVKEICHVCMSVCTCLQLCSCVCVCVLGDGYWIGAMRPPLWARIHTGHECQALSVWWHFHILSSISINFSSSTTETLLFLHWIAACKVRKKRIDCLFLRLYGCRVQRAQNHSVLGMNTSCRVAPPRC